MTDAVIEEEDLGLMPESSKDKTQLSSLHKIKCNYVSFNNKKEKVEESLGNEYLSIYNTEQFTDNNSVKPRNSKKEKKKKINKKKKNVSTEESMSEPELISRVEQNMCNCFDPEADEDFEDGFNLCVELEIVQEKMLHEYCVETCDLEIDWESLENIVGHTSKVIDAEVGSEYQGLKEEDYGWWVLPQIGEYFEDLELVQEAKVTYNYKDEDLEICFEDLEQEEQAGNLEKNEGGGTVKNFSHSEFVASESYGSINLGCTENESIIDVEIVKDMNRVEQIQESKRNNFVDIKVAHIFPLCQEFGMWESGGAERHGVTMGKIKGLGVLFPFDPGLGIAQ